MDIESPELSGEFGEQPSPPLASIDNPPATTYCKNRFELLIMSEAGKPIYSYSKREDAVTLMPLCSALINYAHKTQKETLNSMRTSDNLVINFTTRSPLIIIVIHEADSYIDHLVLVDQIEAQVISILTAKTLKSVLEERPTFDLKRLLYGSEKFLDSILNSSISSPANGSWPWVQAFLAVTASSQSAPTSSGLLVTPNPPLPPRPHRVLIPVVSLPPGTRATLHNILTNAIASNSKNIVFSLLFKLETTTRSDEDETLHDERPEEESLSNVNVTFKLLTVCNHHDKHKLKIADIHIISALLDGLKAQLASVESLWMPVCLPRFNQDAFLHSYISCMNDAKTCLVMMSVDRDEFAGCQKSRNTIEEKLEDLFKDPTQAAKLNYQLSPLVHPVLLELQERLTNASLTSEDLAEAQQRAQIYNSKTETYHARQLQFLWYQTSKRVLWWQRSAAIPLNPIIYYVTKKMLQSSLKTLWLKPHDESIFLGWHVPTFQLYAQFDSTITANEATEVIQRVTNWVKKEEENFSIREYR